jgi:hypothetical protein
LTLAACVGLRRVHERAQGQHVGLEAGFRLPLLVEEVERQRAAWAGSPAYLGTMWVCRWGRALPSQNPAAWSAGSSVGSATWRCFQMATA